MGGLSCWCGGETGNASRLSRSVHQSRRTSNSARPACNNCHRQAIPRASSGRSSARLGRGGALPSRLPARPLALRAAKGKRVREPRGISPSAGGSRGRRSGCRASTSSERRTAVPGVVEPAAAPKDPVRARASAGRIRHRATRIVPIPVPTHSHTFPSMSCNPQPFGAFRPTG